MRYVTTAERIGFEKGFKKGFREGFKKGFRESFEKQILIGETLMAQRFLEQPVCSQAELETKSLKELKSILAETEARLPSS
ncbi:hypothetical protein [Desulfonema magnum]|uniref:Essential protein Yae1 N-terminal domain-containing protein n=1 Tax=Desulfonema magnum TaxID=45655 RepID=A0A975BEJ3_9BACT|nr:hypothetical protein [Desulfonema magnum]QTA84067.1 Uncharacterized protein dnm_000590 [Desulfonema magnum]